MLEHLFNSARKLRGRSFRKRLGCFNYKVKGEGATHKRPGVIPLEVRQKLLKEGTLKAHTEIRELEKKSIYPFGKWNSYGLIIRQVYLRQEKGSSL